MRTKIHTQRLRTLSEKLRTVKREAFDMCHVVWGKPSKLGRGSTACAIGHCPIFFPGEWEFRPRYGRVTATLMGHDIWNSFIENAVEFFGLNYSDAYHVFDPGSDKNESIYHMDAVYIAPSDVSDAIDNLLATEIEA